MLRSELRRLFGSAPPPFWLRALVFAVAYFLCAAAGDFLTPPASGRTYVIFWLPAGLYVAVLLLHAPRQWGWFIAAALPANLAFDLTKGTPFYLILAFYLSNTVQATLGAWLVQTFVSPTARLRTVKEFFGFLALAGIISTLFGALIGAGALYAVGWNNDFIEATKVWWGSCAMAVLLFSPAVLTWCDATEYWNRPVISARKRRRRIIEGLALYGGLIVGTWVIFVMSPGVTTPYKFRTLPLLVWAGLRFGRRGAAAANLIYAALVVYSASHAQDLPPIGNLLTSEVTFTVQTFLVVAALVGLVPAITLAERDAAQLRLKDSEAHYRNLTEAAFEGVCISENGRLLDVSEQLLAMIGYERHEVLGRQIPEFIVPENQATVAEAIRAEKETPYLVGLLRKDGRVLNCEVRAKVVQSSGRTLRMTALRDITERLKVEEALRASEARLRAVSDNLPNGIVYQIGREPDGTMRFLHVSAGVERTHGLTVEAVLRDPQSLYAQIHPEDRARLQAAEERSFQTLQVLDEIVRIHRQDGTLRWVRLCSAPRRKPDGEVIWDGIEIDITESKCAEEALRQSEEKFSKAFLSSPSAIVITRLTDGRIMEANETFARRFALTPESARSRTVFELGIWAGPAERDALMTRLRQEGSLRNIEKTTVLPSGRPYIALLSLELIKLQNEDCLLTVTHDITELKEAQQALQESEAKFRALFNSANDAIFLMDGLRIMDCNRMTEVLFGCPREQILGRTPIDYSPELQPDGETSVAKGDQKIAAVIAGQPQFFEWKHRRVDGTHFDAEVSLNRVDLGGKFFVQAIVRDVTVRKQTEIRLQLLSERLRLATNAAAIAVWEWNLQTNEIAVDQRLYEIYGLPTDPQGRFTYTQWTQCVHPDDLPEQEAALQKTIAAKSHGTREFRIQRPDGTLCYIYAAEIVIRDDKGQATRVVGINMDITERKAAERALRESEERYRAVVEFSPDCIAVAVADRVVYINRAGARMLGGESPATLLARPISDFAPPENHEAIRARSRGVLKTGTSSPRFETVLLRTDGALLSIESQVAPFNYSSQPAVLYLIRDISARKKAERELQENQRMLATLMANLPGMVYRCQNDAHWTMLFVSEGCHALTGYRPKDFLGNQTLSFAAIMHSEDQPRALQTVQAALDRRSVFELNYRIRTAIGEEKWVWERGQGVYASDGKLLALEGFITDITAQRQAEAEREAATRREQETRAEFTRQLIASQEAERTRIAREIHDHLGQLLTALKLDLRSLERRAAVLSDPELQTALLSKLTSAKELADETITSVQKIASELRPGILDRLGLAAAIEAEAQAFEARTGVNCPCAVPEETPPIPQDRAIAAFRIFQEIMTNVARHANATEVQIRLQLSATVLLLEVADNGVGLAEEHFADPKSFGLLGMMERAEILGGQIAFRKPAAGAGTMVTVRLPLGATKLPET